MTELSKFTAATNILIVDDNPDNLRLLTKILEPHGYSIRKSLNGRMALQATHRDPPDLILLDITMPDMDGYTVCQHLRASEVTANIPIIFISALDRINDKVRAFETGGQDYITKPFQELEILMRVKNQLLIQQQQRQLIQQNQRLEQEIQERLKAEAEVRQLSLTDELTGLHNRRSFFLLAEQHIKVAQRTQVPYCLIFVDLDGLKRANDTLGHEVGDRLIVDAAQILTQTFRETDIVARLGGDEFVVLILATGSNSSDDLHLRLQDNIGRFNQICDPDSNPLECRPYQLSMSVGIQFCNPTDDISLESLLVKADKLMYEHKQSKVQALHRS